MNTKKMCTTYKQKKIQEIKRSSEFKSEKNIKFDLFFFYFLFEEIHWILDQNSLKKGNFSLFDINCVR